MLHRNNSRGGALLTALFIMTLVAIVATAMSAKLQLDIYRTRLIIVHDRLYLASQGVIFWGMSELNDPKKHFAKTDKQGMVSVYPAALKAIYPNVKLSGGLYDLQARFNLNNLVNKKYILGFINLMGHTVPEMTTGEKVNVAMAASDWVSAYDLGVGQDQYLSYYLNQKPPYHPSRQLMASNSELRLVKDASSQIYSGLQPYITALPAITPFNLNTSSKNVLMGLSSTMDDEKANKLIAARGEKGIKNLEKIKEILQQLNIANEQVTLESNYFLVVANATSENSSLNTYTLLKRTKDKKGKITVNILRESFNIF